MKISSRLTKDSMVMMNWRYGRVNSLSTIIYPCSASWEGHIFVSRLKRHYNLYVYGMSTRLSHSERF
jgi:hypothetical protein